MLKRGLYISIITLSLLYKLFGKPRTVDEFVDLVKRRREREVQIKIQRRYYPEGCGLFTYISRPILQTGKYRLKSNGYKGFTVLGYKKDARKKGDSVDNLAFIYAEEIAEKLKNQGLNVKNIKFLEKD